MEMFFLYRTNISHLAKRNMIKSAFERGLGSSQQVHVVCFLQVTVLNVGEQQELKTQMMIPKLWKHTKHIP